MFFYNYFCVQGRELLADLLLSADPFGLEPAEIVKRIIGLGYTPDLEHSQSEMCSTIGRVFEVRREKQEFLVAIGRDAEEISVQEMRAEAYPIE